MRIEKFALTNFRSVVEMELKFSWPTTAIVGDNGVGKSTILDALAIALSQLTARIIGQPSRSRDIAMDDIKTGSSFARLVATADIDTSEVVTWAVAKNKIGASIPPSGRATTTT